MTTRNLGRKIKAAVNLQPLLRTSTPAPTSSDTNTYEGAAVLFICGALTDGTFTPKLQESADDSTYTDVAAADLDATLVAMTANTVQKVGYLGHLRYIKAVITVTGSPGTGANIAVVTLLNDPHATPTT